MEAISPMAVSNSPYSSKTDMCGSSSVSPILPSALVNVGRGGHLSERNAPNIGAIATVSTTSASVSVVTEDEEANNNTSIGQPLDATISAKRRRSVLTLEQKLEIIKRAKKGERVMKLPSYILFIKSVFFLFFLFRDDTRH